MTVANLTTKPCKTCGETKPLSDFYTHPGTKDGHLNYCKPCFIAKQNARPKHPKDQAVNAGEKMTIAKLKTVGIHAVPGKMTQWKHQDVAAGAVRLEIKKAKIKQDGTYLFKFDSQVRSGMKSHIVIMICDDGVMPTYHVFPSGHDVFFNKKDQRKKGIQYQPFAKHRKLNATYTLTPELMTAQRDRWDLIVIEQQRLEGIAA